MRSLVSVALGMLLTLLAGCFSPVHLEMAQPASASARQPALSAKSVAVALAPTVDERPAFQKETLGRVGGREILGADLTVWVDRSLATLHGKHFSLTRENDERRLWRITPRLRQFYASSLAVSKNANVVLELLIEPANQPALTRIYRGRITSVNWWNSASEMEVATHSALADCLKLIEADLDALAGAPAS